MQLDIETQVLYELALSIGESTDLYPMLRHTVSELLRLTNASGACVIQMGAGNEVGDAKGHPDYVCTLPRNLHRHASHRAFSTRWQLAPLYHTLLERPEQLPLTVQLADASVHAFLLPHFGVLLLFRKQGPLAENFLRAFGPLARKLGSAARSSKKSCAGSRGALKWRRARRTSGCGSWIWPAVH
jgi:hypothetical protein